MSPLDPHRLTPSASINRVHIVNLPGLNPDTEVKGRTGYQLVSAAALSHMIRQYAPDLQLDPSADDGTLHQALDSSFTSSSQAVRAAAEAIGRRIGRNLGYVLLTLKRGDPVNRAARSEWDDSYWHHWNSIEQVWLGGGLVSGRLGCAINQYAGAVFAKAGVDGFAIQVSPYASVLPLVGVARYAPPGCDAALAFDLGSTMIKRAHAIYERGELAELRLLPACPTGWTGIEEGTTDLMARAAQFLDDLVSLIASTWQSVGLSPSHPILASVAAYVEDGQPMPAQGGTYTSLRNLTDSLQKTLAQQLSTRLGDSIVVSLIHDGTAAAATYAGLTKAAVITIGTALGIGFPPELGTVHPMSRDFAVFAPSADPESIE